MTPSWLIWQLSWRSTVWAVFMSALVLSTYISSLMMVVLVINAIMHGWDSDIHGMFSIFRFLTLAALLGGSVGAAVGLIVGIATGLLVSLASWRGSAEVAKWYVRTATPSTSRTDTMRISS